MFLRDTPDRTAMHREEFLSVAIASCDRFDFLHRVIDAVHEHADMAYEIVVADDAGHRHPDLSVFNPFRDKVSRLVINTGNNMGLAVNANQAIAATRGRHVVFLSDDSLVMRPFMREVWSTLESAPYVGVLNLGQTYDPSTRDVSWIPPATYGARVAERVTHGFINVETQRGQRLSLHCQHDASWACAFRRAYWLEVGGYSEDDVYGDLPFINKGWLRGYFSAVLGGDQIARDLDMTETHGKRSSVAFRAHSVLCHYPRLFHLPVDAQLAMSRIRNDQCSARNHLGRSERFNEFGCEDWVRHMREVMETGTPNWDRLARFHSRFLAELQRDLEPVR